eukprot:TRINITY_DN75606_c0_g1_i1.p1 TRINITY_DN75606_c0_g1~~TRINITY_DN75606_c0_g1_i1.p1  ORF type:complete len:282 (-),score=9.22 TRINITY_DN75606_c0_g1_i1:72-869(-)
MARKQGATGNATFELEINSTTNWHELCEDVLGVVFGFLPTVELLTLQPVSRFWYSMLTYRLAQGIQVKEYTSDYDENGIMYYIGCKFGTLPFDLSRLGRFASVRTSQGETSLLKRAGNLSWNNNCINLLAREGCRCFLTGSGDSKTWFEIDLGPRFRVIPSYYTLRHGSSQGRAPRNWDLQASIDRDSWYLLKAHRADNSIDTPQNSTASWPVEPFLPPDVEEGWRFFRLVCQGVSAQHCNWFHINGFEVYGMFQAVITKAVVTL